MGYPLINISSSSAPIWRALCSPTPICRFQPSLCTCPFPMSITFPILSKKKPVSPRGNTATSINRNGPETHRRLYQKFTPFVPLIMYFHHYNGLSPSKRYKLYTLSCRKYTLYVPFHIKGEGAPPSRMESNKIYGTNGMNAGIHAVY